MNYASSPTTLNPVDEKTAYRPKRKFEYNLEGLRGLAALVVAWFHAVSIGRMVDAQYTLSGAWAYPVPGHLSVLLFFILSGYVIGITNPAPLAGQAVGAYLKKRFVRIYPIYAVALLLTWVVAQPYPPAQWLAHFSLTQVLLAPMINENAPAWSLHYEALYYLLFIPLSVWRVNAWAAAGACFLLGLFNQLMWPANTLLTSYSYGFTFWLCGLGLAQNDSSRERRYTAQLLVALLLLFLSMRYFNVFETLLLKGTHFAVGQRLHYWAGAEQFRSVITFADLAFLPVGVVYLLVFTNQDFPGRRVVLRVLFGLPAATFLYLGLHYHELDLRLYYLPAAFYVAAVMLAAVPLARMEAVAARTMQRLVELGGISYGLYIIHFPIMTGLKQVTVFSGTGFAYAVRCALALLLSVLLAHFLEKKFQPLVRKLLKSREPELLRSKPY
ncbi:MAG TPA: acyltransferase [Hymenobacter sp.]|jgi:peptidoglycan/LPS O-acetylase OafA/YrhL|uniref:acyltransferase family protein n=1 Tax=Hymenobacter sp. TaxID=1898978 RepID=UPI002EDB07DC